jgi:hypothetical protein
VPYVEYGVPPSGLESLMGPYGNARLGNAFYRSALPRKGRHSSWSARQQMRIQTKLAFFLISISRTQAWVRGVSKHLHVMNLSCLLFCCLNFATTGGEGAGIEIIQ